MREQTLSCHVELPCEVLWAYLADYRNVVALASPSQTVELVEGTHGNVGARYQVAVDWEGLRSRFENRLVDATEPSLLVYEGHAPGSIGSARFDLQHDGSGTTVSVTVSLSIHLSPLEPFGWAIDTRMHDRLMRNHSTGRRGA